MKTFFQHAADVKENVRTSTVSLKIDDRGRPFVTALSAPSAPAQTEQILSVVTSLVSGVFQTWPTKGLFGPIPAFDTQIKSVRNIPHGLTFDLNVPGAPVLVYTDHDFVTKRISSVGGMTIENTIYTPSSRGLVFTGNNAISKN
jgi:hypothetical protein